MAKLALLTALPVAVVALRTSEDLGNLVVGLAFIEPLSEFRRLTPLVSKMSQLMGHATA